MLNGHHDANTKSYLLALQAGHKPDNKPDIPEYWQEVTDQVEWLWLRSKGDTEAVSRLMNALRKQRPDLDEMLKDERPASPALARVDEPGTGLVGTELQEALISAKDMARIQEHISEIAAWDDITLAKFKMNLKTFWPTFPMREFLAFLHAEKRRIGEQSRARPVVKSAHDLMSVQFPQKSWIVPGILPPGLIALAGKQKIGKSWLDYNLCLAVGGGGKAFGSIDVEEGDVLYMALEDNEQRLQTRFKQLLGPDEVMPRRIDYVTEWPRMDEFGVAALEQWIQSKQNPRLIVIDPWVKVKPRVRARQGETGYDADYEALEGIKRLGDTYKVCILVQFHLRKAGGEDPFDELNGTSGVTACADGFLSLKRSRGESDATLWGTGRDFQEDVDLALKFDDGYWNILGNAQEYALSKASKEIVEALNQSDRPLYPKELAKLLEIPEGTVRKRLFDMKNRDEVKDTGKGYVSVSSSAQRGNEGNSRNEGNAHNVTSDSECYDDEQHNVTPIRPGVEPLQEVSVTPLPLLPYSANIPTELHKEAQQLLSEVQVLFEQRSGIRQMWRDDINPVRQLSPDTYIKKVQAALESGDLQSIQLAATAMKWTTGRLSPGREKEPAPLQG